MKTPAGIRRKIRTVNDYCVSLSNIAAQRLRKIEICIT